MALMPFQRAQTVGSLLVDGFFLQTVLRLLSSIVRKRMWWYENRCNLYFDFTKCNWHMAHGILKFLLFPYYIIFLTIENNNLKIHCDPSIKSDKRQHLQFLRCFSFNKTPPDNKLQFVLSGCSQSMWPPGEINTGGNKTTFIHFYFDRFQAWPTQALSSFLTLCSVLLGRRQQKGNWRKSQQVDSFLSASERKFGQICSCRSTAAIFTKLYNWPFDFWCCTLDWIKKLFARMWNQRGKN